MKYIIFGIVYTALIIGVHFYGKNYNVKVGSGYKIFFTLINILVYFLILILWFFTQQKLVHEDQQGFFKTLLHSGLGITVFGIGIFIMFLIYERLLQGGNKFHNNDNKDNEQRNYCVDTCSWFTQENQCKQNQNWNNADCIWNAAAQLCASPKENNWTGNILRSVATIITVIILLAIFADKDKIQQTLRQNKWLAWILLIPQQFRQQIEIIKRDLKITTPTTWILVGIELIIILIYTLANFHAHQAYDQDGIMIYNPPIGISFKTVVGCNALNQINKNLYNQEDYENVDKSNTLFTIKKGSISNLLPWTDEKKENDPIPKDTVSMTTELVIRKEMSTDNTYKMDTTHYNYGISLWFYIDPHQASLYQEPEKDWISLFSYAEKPILMYHPIKNALQIKTLLNEYTGATPKYKETRPIPDIPLQKWNHLFINSTDANIDLFLNGNIVSTIVQVIPNNETDEIITGDHRGIVGRICNIYYFKRPLNKIQIIDIYHKYKNNNPPVSY